MTNKPVWVALVVITEERIRHIRGRGIAENEIRDLCCFGSPAETVWDDDPVRGRRLLVRGRTSSGRRLLCVLRPHGQEDDAYIFVTAIPD